MNKWVRVSLFIGISWILGACGAGNSATNDFPKFNVTGVVVTQNGSLPLGGVKLSVTGDASTSVTSDETGKFTISGLYKGRYVVTPEKTNYSFQPFSSAILDISNKDVGNVNFVASDATQVYRVAGKVSSCGVAVAGVYVNLTAVGNSGVAISNASGDFEFRGLPPGSYRASPQKTGYSFSVETNDFTVASQNVDLPDFAPQFPSHCQLSGTINYSGNARGRIFVRLSVISGVFLGVTDSLYPLGTNISQPGQFTLRGVGPGRYSLTAFMDTSGDGEQRAASPAATLQIDTMTDPLAHPIITLTESAPEPLTAPSNVQTIAEDRVLRVSWDKQWSTTPSTFGSVASGYKVYWGATASTMTRSAMVTDTRAVLALENGTYYVKVAPLQGSVEGPASATVGPVTLSPGIGGYNLFGNIRLPGSMSAPVYVAAFNIDGNNTDGQFARAQMNGASGTYRISGLLKGRYLIAAIADTNNSSTIDGGDLINFYPNAKFPFLKGGPFLQVDSNKNLDIVMSSPTHFADKLSILTDHYKSNTSENISINYRAFGIGKRVVGAILSGAEFPPTDFAAVDGGLDIDRQMSGGRTPSGEVLNLAVTFADGTTQQTNVATPVALGVPENLRVDVGSGRTRPTFRWDPPAGGAEGPIQYSFYLRGPNANLWLREIPGTQTFFTPTDALQSGQSYFWSVTVTDTKGNSAEVYEDRPYVP